MLLHRQGFRLALYLPVITLVAVSVWAVLVGWQANESHALVAAPVSYRTIAPAVHAALAGTSDVEIIVTLKHDRAGYQLDPNAHVTGIMERSARVIAAVPREEFSVVRQYQAVPALAGTATALGVASLAAHPDVIHIGLDEEVQASLAQAMPLIQADAVHNILGVTGDGVVVAVLDTGIDTDHPLLMDDLNHQACFLADETCPGGGTTGSSAEDGAGHGSHVSGIITSGGPPIGVAPDALIDAFKVLNDSGNGSFSDILAAYNEIILNHPEVDLINMSLSDGGSYSPGTCETIIPAFTTAISTTRSMGITSFAASGNGGSKIGIAFPACINDIVSVGAVYDADVGSKSWGPCTDPTTAADQVVCFSQSNISLDLLAPGSAIDSTVPGGGLANFSGTSMASPAAAAVGALLLESEPLLAPAGVETRLKETGVLVTDAGNGVTSCRVDAYEALVNDGGPICESSELPPPACPLEGNDGFEVGLVGMNAIPCWTVVDQVGGSGSWCGQTGTALPQSACSGSFVSVGAPPEGMQAAMTNQNGHGSHLLYRCLALPDDLLSFELYINNESGIFHSPPSLDYDMSPNQQFRADLVTEAGMAGDPFTVAPPDILLNLYQTRPGDPPVSAYSTVTTNVGAYVGQTVCLRFAQADNQFFFHVGIDDVRFSSAVTPTPCPAACPTPTATPTPTLTNTPTPTVTLTATPTLTITPTPTPTITLTPTKQPDSGDTDGDGCSDQRENGPDETLGGLRDYKNRWDFYDVLGPGAALPIDGVVDLANDILGVIQRYAPSGAPPYDVQFDRGPSSGPNPWNMTAPDGVIDLPNDILGVILQFNHRCV